MILALFRHIYLIRLHRLGLERIGSIYNSLYSSKVETSGKKKTEFGQCDTKVLLLWNSIINMIRSKKPMF